ncbi:DUF4198 domain-containing protein [Croceitalea sp. MTPC5]|uniref:DUF4198 domain-containing protein n=1 Tax=Croceitalea sp. MTPC5 TaxID=3056565 RepID=UPI00403F4E8D
MKEREKDVSLDKDAKENYSKHVKPLLQVSDKRTKGFNTVFGYPVEFVPIGNPHNSKVNEPMRFKLLDNGQLLSNHVVHY